MQLEFSCRLAQAKLLSRGRANNAVPLSELSLAFQVSIDIFLSSLKQKQLNVVLSNPLIFLSDGLY